MTPNSASRGGGRVTCAMSSAAGDRSEGQVARDELEEHAPEGVEVRRLVAGRLARCDLGAQVGRRAPFQRGTDSRLVPLADPRDAEVRQERVPAVEEHVLGLDVAV